MEAIRFIKETKCSKNIMKVAIIDGVIWLNKKLELKLKNLAENEFCFSVLLLKKFIKRQF